MASSSCVNEVLPEKIASSVSSEDSWDSFRNCGFFYQEDESIGKLVAEHGIQDKLRHVQLDDIKRMLRVHPELMNILSRYHTKVDRFRFPWGKLDGYYRWSVKDASNSKAGLIIYINAPGSRWICRAGSSELDWKEKVSEYGVAFPVVDEEGVAVSQEEALEKYPKEEITLDEGGVLLVQPRLIHAKISGISITFALLKKDEGL